MASHGKELPSKAVIQESSKGTAASQHQLASQKEKEERKKEKMKGGRKGGRKGEEREERGEENLVGLGTSLSILTGRLTCHKPDYSLRN